MDTANISGERIKAVRKSRGLRQIELSAALAVDYDININATGICKIERNQRSLKDYQLRAIAQILEVSMDYLAGNSEVDTAGPSFGLQPNSPQSPSDGR